MRDCRTQVYFALKGDDFNPQKVTEILGIHPTDSWQKGDKGKYIPIYKFSSWMLSTDIGTEYLNIDRLVAEIVEPLYEKIELINEAKSQLGLESVLEVVLYIDVNEENSTPSVIYDLKTIEFLFKTKTIVDIDIHRFEST
ncbi:MAG: hypothetical protein RIS29_1731 [Bacteroidota bacterium]|jgi:hypothetical protein